MTEVVLFGSETVKKQADFMAKKFVLDMRLKILKDISKEKEILNNVLQTVKDFHNEDKEYTDSVIAELKKKYADKYDEVRNFKFE